MPATAGFAETLAASIEVKRRRGGDVADDLRRLEQMLAFLLRQQWSGDTCFACQPEPSAVGAFSQSMVSPRVRVDYVQHAWAALGHGGRQVSLRRARAAAAREPAT